MTGGRLWRSRCPQTAAPGVSQPVATRKVVAESDNSMARKLSAAAQREERRDRVMTLVLYGYSIRQIARQTGISHGTVQRDINARLEAAAAQCPQTIQYRELHRERLNQLFFKWWPRAMKDLAALDRVLKLLRQEAKLLGLDAPPQKVEQTAKEYDTSALQKKPDLSVLK